MNSLLTLSIAAALGLASAANAQDAAAPSAASSAHQRDTTSTKSTESAPSGSTEPSAASSQTQRDAVPATHVADASKAGTAAGKSGAEIVGATVQSSTGENLGEVKEVLVDDKGSASYAVISHGSVMGIGAKRTAVPWATVKAMMQGDKLVMDGSQLKDAPVLAGSKTPDVSSGTWSRDADAYWRAKVSTRATDTSATTPSN